jgi:periplasmic copper chaperone A
MRNSRSSTALAAAIALLLGASGALAQSPSITVTNAWARRAAMAHGAMAADKSKDSMSGMAMDKSKDSMSEMDKGKDSMAGMDKGMHGMAGEGATSAVYLTIDNAGSQADALVSASSAAAKAVELHEVKNEGGTMKMRPVQKIPLPAGGKVELKPGGYHVMLIGLTRDLKPGETVPVTLVFEHGAQLKIDAAVK